ncbi:snRNA-activating protein complex subunit 3-like [Glandiceps talaboti]
MAENVNETTEGDSKEINMSSVIHVGDFLGLCSEVIEEDDMSIEKNEVSQEKIAQAMDTPLETIEELSNVCSLDSLKCPGEKYLETRLVDLTVELPPGTENLLTIVTRKRSIENRKLKRSCNTLSWELEHQHISTIPNEDSMLTEPDVLLSVVFFHPLVKHSRAVIDKEILILGQQCLMDLKEKILCVSDLSVPGDFSEAPDLPQDNKAQDNFKSSFFYIENVFYNDMSHPLCRDLSIPIKEWAKERKRGWPMSFTTQKMEETTLNELNIKLGKPYLYCHQGDCEHVIAFSDLRLLHADDCHDLSQYPLVTRKLQYQRLICRVCKLFTSKWVTEEDSHAPEDPCFFCDKCFRMLHYDQNGCKIGHFRAYPFIDKGIFN